MSRQLFVSILGSATMPGLPVEKMNGPPPRSDDLGYVISTVVVCGVITSFLILSAVDTVTGRVLLWLGIPGTAFMGFATYLATSGMISAILRYVRHRQSARKSSD